MKFATLIVAFASIVAVEGGHGHLKSRQSGGFITSPCASDSACSSGCCGFTSAKCEGACVALQRQGCGQGTASPNANAAAALGACSSLVQQFLAAHASGAGSGSGAAAPAASAAPATSGNGGTGTSSAQGARGSQFITGACAANNDCVSGCCVSGKLTCGAVGAQPNGAADCLGGVALPNLNGGGSGSGAGAAAPAASAAPATKPASGGTGTSSASGARGSQFITGACAANNDCVSGCCVSGKLTCGAVGAQKNGAADCLGGVALPNLNGGGSGSGAGAAAAPANNPPANSGAGTSTGSASGARGSQFITGACAANNDCVSGCCVSSKLTCGAVGAQKNGAADCLGGSALPNLNGRFF